LLARDSDQRGQLRRAASRRATSDPADDDDVVVVLGNYGFSGLGFLIALLLVLAAPGDAAMPYHDCSAGSGMGKSWHRKKLA